MPEGIDPSQTIITIDVDWAPDWMIDKVARCLVEANVAATWFITHESPSIRRLRDYRIFEIGAHPNFLPGSSHGSEFSEIANCVRNLAPEARALRTHSLFQSELQLAELVEKYGFSVDASIHLPQMANISPHRIKFSLNGPALVRVPHVFQDNMYMYSGLPWSVSTHWCRLPGLKVFDFHPVHIVMNSRDPSRYEALKRLVPINLSTEDDIGKTDEECPGAGYLFRELVDVLSATGGRTLSDFVDGWEKEESA